MIKFYSRNLVDQSIITPSSENMLFPKSNLLHPFRTKVFRSTSNETTILFDLGETSQIDSVILVDDKKDGFGFTSAKIQLNGGTDFTSPAFEQDIEINQKHHFASAFFDVKTYRYARLVFTSSLGFCEVANVFIGKSIQDDEMNVDYGWGYGEEELSKITKNRRGQKFVDVIARQKQISFSLNTLNQDELDLVFDVWDEKGTTKPFFLRIGNSDMINDPDRFAGMFYLSSKPRVINKAFALYDLNMTVEEAM